MTMTADNETTLKEGRVVAIAGPVVDVEFPPDSLPEINTALHLDIELDGKTILVTAEVAQQIGDGRVRVICMSPTDGLKRGTVVRNTGRGITMPVGDGVLGTSSTCSASRSTSRPISSRTSTTGGRSTATRRLSTSSKHGRRCSRPASR